MPIALDQCILSPPGKSGPVPLIDRLADSFQQLRDTQPENDRDYD
jgi:hypothetical protein